MTDNLPTAPQPQRAIARVESVQPLFSSDQFEHFQRAAKALMYSTLLPESVRGPSPEACFSNLMLVFDLSDRWKMPPLAVAQCIAIVHNKVVYEGKLITAMLTAQGLDLDFHYTGERGTPGYRVYVSDRAFTEMTDEQLAALAPGKYPRGWRIIDGSVADWQTTSKDNKVNPAWTGQSQHNQLAYRGSREWCRLYESGLLLGVYGEDEIQDYADRRELRDITPAGGGISVGFTAPRAEQDVASAAATAPAVDPKGDGQATTANAATDQPGAGTVASEPPADKPKVKAKDVVSTGEEMADVWERAFAAGRAGEDGAAPKDLKRTDQQESWAQGWNAGAAERLNDPELDDDDGEDDEEADEDEDGGATGNEMLDAIAEVEPELMQQVLEDHGDDLEPGLDDDGPGASTMSAFEAFNMAVRSLPDWPAINLALAELSRSEDWKAAVAAKDRTAPRQARIAAWMRVRELGAKGGEPPVRACDNLTAYRCWLEATDDPQEITDGWQELVLTPVYESLKPEAKQMVEGFTTARLEVLRA